MSFTLLFAVFALLALGILFGLMYKLRGAKTAVITTAIAFVVLALLFVTTIYAIVSVMPN